MTAWVPVVNFLADGENVNAITTNRPLTDLANRTQHLKEIVDQASAGELLVIRDASVLAGTAVGHWVYYDNTTLQYKKAIAELIPTISGMITGPRSFVVGFVAALSSPTVALIVTGGLFRDLGGIFTALLQTDYYLSDTIPGEITDVLPAVPIFVGMKNVNATFQVSIDTKDLINSGDANYTFAVTSVATTNTNLVVTGCESGNPIPPGPLDPYTKDITVTLPNTVVTDDAPAGGLVVKATNGGVGLKRGWVAEKLLAGPGITLSSTHTTVNVNPLLTTYQGEITVTATSALNTATIQITSLNNAREEILRGILCHSFPQLIISSMRLKVVVPGVGAKTLSIKLWVAGSVAGALPNITAAYQELLDPGIVVAGPILAGDTAIAPVVLSPIGASFQYFAVNVPNIVCTGGSILHINLERLGNVDGYTGAVSILSMEANIS